MLTLPSTSPLQLKKEFTELLESLEMLPVKELSTLLKKLPVESVHTEEVIVHAPNGRQTK